MILTLIFNPYPNHIYPVFVPLLMSTIAERIKELTSVQHQAAEDSLIPRITGIRSVKDYVAVLHCFYGFFHPLLGKIHQVLTSQDLPDIAQRRSTDLIQLDLRNLNYPDNHIPISTELPGIQSTADAFGALYVVEGSTLGGKVIRKMLLQQNAVPLTESCLNFFDAYGPETVSRWRSFQQALNRQPDTEPIVSTAQQTFTLFNTWINQTI